MSWAGVAVSQFNEETDPGKIGYSCGKDHFLDGVRIRDEMAN